MGKITIVTATDLHYLAPELQDGGKAFQEMMVFADGRITEHSDALLDVFVEEMLALRPDAVILTGDLTFNGERISHERVSTKLYRLTENGTDVLVIPGNHDLENPLAGSYTGEEAKSVPTVTGEEFAKLYEPCRGARGHLVSRYASSLGYMWALNEKLWILAVDVNGNTCPGEVSRGTLAWAGGQLRRAQENHAAVIGISHQNLFVYNEMFGASYQMAGADRLTELYRSAGVKLHLSGHMHVQHGKESGGVTEIITESLAMGSCRYGVLTIDTESGEAQYRTEQVRRFSAYAKQYFLNFYTEKMTEELRQTGMLRERAARLAAGFARLNLAFYEGSAEQLADREQIRADWKKEAPGSFWNQYIDSILDEGLSGQTHFHIRVSS